MNLFTQLMEIDEMIGERKEEQRQQALFGLGTMQQIGGCETIIPENNKEKLTPLASGFGLWG